jgi:glycosyltransferase involved in cell wall biosynthesis
VGEGAEKARIKSLATTRGLTNVHFLDQQPRERIPGFISASDACLVLLKKTEIFKTVIPTKMLEFMACARPIIVGVEGQARKIVEDANAGIAIEPENAEALAQAIVQLANTGAVASEFGRKGREYILKNLSRQTTAQIYIRVLDQLLSNSARQG